MALQLFRGAPMSIPKADPSHEKPTSPLASNAISKSLFWRVSVNRQRFISIMVFQKQPLHVKASQNTSVATSAYTSEKNSSGPLQKNVQQSTFSIGFQALVEDVCEQTQIAELKLKSMLLGWKTKLMDDREGGFAKCSILAIVYLNTVDRQILLATILVLPAFLLLERMEKLNG